MKIIIRNKLVVLGLLKEQPMHGYQIDQEIKRRSMDMWANISMASIYNALTALENKGMISVKKEKVGKMPERNVYKITKKGEKELFELVKDGIAKKVKHNNVVFNLAMGFVVNITPLQALESLNKRKKQIEAVIEKVIKIHEELKTEIPFNWLYIIENGLEHLEADLNGTKNLINKIKKIKKWDKPGGDQ